MKTVNNKESTRVEAQFCRLDWVAKAIEAARSHHAGKTEDELTAFGLVNPVPDQQRTE